MVEDNFSNYDDDLDLLETVDPRNIISDDNSSTYYNIEQNEYINQYMNVGNYSNLSQFMNQNICNMNNLNMDQYMNQNLNSLNQFMNQNMSSLIHNFNNINNQNMINLMHINNLNNQSIFQNNFANFDNNLNTDQVYYGYYAQDIQLNENQFIHQNQYDSQIEYSSTSENDFNKKNDNNINCNPVQVNIQINFFNNIECFGNEQVINTSYEIISTITDNFNTKLIFPPIEDIKIYINELTHNWNKIDKLFNKIVRIRTFILNVVETFEKINKNEIEVYKNIMPKNIQNEFGNIAYIFPIIYVYLFKLKQNCLPLNIKKSIQSYSVNYPQPHFSEILKDIIENYEVKKRTPNKDSKTLTNHFGFNLFISLFLNINYSLLKQVYENQPIQIEYDFWININQCPLCSFRSESTTRTNSSKNALIKHLKNCPGLQLRPDYYDNKKIFSNKSIWTNESIANSISNSCLNK